MRVLCPVLCTYFAVMFKLIQFTSCLQYSEDTDVKEREEMVELLSFATLPHIKTCGHDASFDAMYKKLITDGFEEHMIRDAISVLQNHYNCLGLTCKDIGRHIKLSTSEVPCSMNLDIIGYTPLNSTKTNMIAKLDLDAVAIHQLMSMEKDDAAKKIYLEGHNYYDYDSPNDFSFVSLHNLTQSHTIDFTDFQAYRLYESYFGSADFSNDLIIHQIFERSGPFISTTATQRNLALNVAISSFVSYMSALQALYFSVSRCASDVTSAETAFDGAVALLVGSVEGRGRGGSAYLEGQMLYSVSKRNCEHFHNCRGRNAEVNLDIVRVMEEGQSFLKQGNCLDLSKAVESIDSLLKVPLIQSILYFSDSTISMQSDDDAAGYVATMAALPILDDIDSSSANTIKSGMDLTASTSMSSESKEDTVYKALGVVFSNPDTQGIVDCELVTTFNEICNPDKVVVDGGGDVQQEVQVIEPEKPMPISNGLYVATNYVGDRSAIAFDIQEIEDNLQYDVAEAKHVYLHGRNSKIYNENGMPTGELRSISRFSTESDMTMRGDPTYNVFVYGLSDENQEFLGRPATRYADSFISDLLYSEAPEASAATVSIAI